MKNIVVRVDTTEVKGLELTRDTFNSFKVLEIKFPVKVSVPNVVIARRISGFLLSIKSASLHSRHVTAMHRLAEEFANEHRISDLLKEVSTSGVKQTLVSITTD